MNNIVIEDGFSLLNPTGIGQYTTSIRSILSSLNINIILIKKNCLISIKNKIIRRIFYNIWLNSLFFIRLLLINKKITVIFPNFAIPIFKNSKIKYISVIHDICPIKYRHHYSILTNFNERQNIYNAIKKADTIVTVSETIKNELIQTFNIDQHRIKVVYNSIGEHFINSKDKTEILDKYNIQKQKYILSVATLNKRKNIPELIKAFANISDKYPELKLVLVGGMGNEKREKLTKHPNIIFTGYIPDEDLPSLYQNALLYVFPSLYEGFGIPIIEAQFSNCPVLCSDIPVFREIAGNSAEFCIPDSNGIAAKLEYLINNGQRRQELISLGKENVKRFSIEKIEEQLLKVLECKK